jgi:L-seryl-tRNA(Ser) seleniumtransferase
MLGYISDKVTRIATVKAEVVRPTGRSNVYPSLRITWDESRVKITPQEVEQQLLEGQPRIATSRGRIVAPTLVSGEEVAVAQKYYDILSRAV